MVLKKGASPMDYRLFKDHSTKTLESGDTLIVYQGIGYIVQKVKRKFHISLSVGSQQVLLGEATTMDNCVEFIKTKDTEYLFRRAS
jgi:hypothetical protein